MVDLAAYGAAIRLSLVMPTHGAGRFRVLPNTAAPLGGLNYQEVAVVALSKQKRCRKLAPAWHARFLAMLPAIVTHARITFQRYDPESRAEAIQSVAASSFVAYARLVDSIKRRLPIRTSDVAKRFKVTEGRISQLRRELAESWRAFQSGELVPDTVAYWENESGTRVG